ncbi:MAG: DUF3426 domain-containing protein [Rhizomicrobium sp.]|nr:DUF3426 domain-containing protein [Rhizomicrobium sp.]
MILTCPSCVTRYEVDGTKFPPSGRDVRCAKCGHVWHALPNDEVMPAPAPEPPPAEDYQQPYSRDPEPQSGAAEDEYYEEREAEPVAPRAAWYTRKPVLIAGWSGLVAVVLVIGLVASVYRREVVEVWPKTASLYSGLGVKLASAGLKIDNYKTFSVPQNGQIVLTVTGAVTNVANRELPVPQIRVGLVDREKRELYHWTVAPQVMTLKPGQSTRFVTRLSNPPDGAANYEIRFAKAGE